jgi:hypothetical protein
MDEPDINIPDILQKLQEDGVFEQVEAEHRAELSADPEWAFQEWIHLRDVVTAFSVGILSSYPWYKGFQVPTGFEAVMNRLALAVQAKWPGPDNELVELSLLEIEDFYREFVEGDEQCQAWNRIGGVGDKTVAFVTRYSITPVVQQFIDLGALTRNAAIWIRAERRRHAESDKSFEAKYGHLED